MTIEKYEYAGYKLRLFEYRDRWALEIKKGSARKIKSLKTKNLETAKDEFYKYKLELKEKGRLDIIFDTDLLRQIEIFLEWSKINSNSPRTFEKHNESMNKFLDFLKQNRIEAITPSLNEKFKMYLLNKGLATRTVDLHLTSLSKMITVLEELEIIPRGVYKRPKLIRAKSVKAPKFWTSEEVERILQVARRTYIYGMLVVALNTGLRLNELRYLRWDDVVLEQGFLLIQSHPEDGFNPKDYELRRIKLNTATIQLLAELRGKKKDNAKYVFSNKYGLPRKNNLYRDLLRILDVAGVTDKGAWHCARRTWGSHAIMAGADPKSVQRIYGHSRLETTQAYLNVTNKHLDETMDLVEFTDNKELAKVLPFKGKD